MFRGRRGRVKTGSCVSAPGFIVSHKREGRTKTALPRELGAGCFPRVIAVVRDCNLVLPSYVELQYANAISLHHQHRGTVETDAVSSSLSDKHWQEGNRSSPGNHMPLPMRCFLKSHFKRQRLGQTHWEDDKHSRAGLEWLSRAWRIGTA